MTCTERARIERTRQIIATCGGAASVAQITGKAVSRVYSWTYPAARHGTNGVIPAREQEKLLEYARANDLPLAPSDFFPPAPVKEVA